MQDLIRAARKWWISRKIDAHVWEEAYFKRGMDAASQRFQQYKDQADAAQRRAILLRQKYTEVDHPIRHLKSLMQ